MRRNCPKCGERYEGDVCPKCGTPAKLKKVRNESSVADKFLTDEQRAAAHLKSEQSKKDSKALIFLIIIVVAAVVFIFYRNGLIGGGSYKKPIEQYFKAISERDFNSYVGTMPRLMGQDYINEREELGYSEYEYLDLLYSDLFTQFGDDMTVELEYFGRQRPEAEIIKNFESAYLQSYGETINTDTVYGVSVVAHFNGEISAADVELECFVLRQGGKWYMVGCDFAVEPQQ